MHYAFMATWYSKMYMHYALCLHGHQNWCLVSSIVNEFKGKITILFSVYASHFSIWITMSPDLLLKCTISLCLCDRSYVWFDLFWLYVSDNTTSIHSLAILRMYSNTKGKSSCTVRNTVRKNGKVSGGRKSFSTIHSM